jgi:hypothetical protein
MNGALHTRLFAARAVRAVQDHERFARLLRPEPLILPRQRGMSAQDAPRLWLVGAASRG